MHQKDNTYPHRSDNWLNVGIDTYSSVNQMNIFIKADREKLISY